MNSQVRRLLDLAQDLELFRTPDGKLYATAKVKNHCENWGLRSAELTRLLQHRYYFQTKEMPASQCVQEVIRSLEGKAQFDAAEFAVFLRVAEHSGRIYVDLADDEWQVVEIGSDGWRIAVDPPVRFRRARGMQALPRPVPGGSISELRSLINVGNDSDWVLIVAWLLATLFASGPYPIMEFCGEQGSSKTTLARMLHSLIDPTFAAVRAEPVNAQDLVIAASNSWILSFDNLSRVSVWLSDALCRLATGGGHATRQLYSDDQEALFRVQRPVILTGIGEVATRSDLLSRLIVIELPPISPSQRRPECELWREFEAARPRILGGLLDAVATALQRLPTRSLPYYPRMADFAVRVSAAEPSLGWPEGTFLKAYDKNQASANDLALESSCITPPLFALLRKGRFEGTTAALLRAISRNTDEATTKQRGWPRNPRALSEILRRLAPNLMAANVELSFWKATDRQRTRMIGIQFCASASSAASEETLIEITPAGESLGLQAEDLIAQRLNEAREEAVDIIHKAKQNNDLKSAVAGVRELTRIAQLEHENRSELERGACTNALPGTLQPLPGSLGGRPLTESDKQALAEIEKFSPADRMAGREGFTAAVTLAELARRPPEPDDE